MPESLLAGLSNRVVIGAIVIKVQQDGTVPHLAAPNSQVLEPLPKLPVIAAISQAQFEAIHGEHRVSPG
jgi:hypothetical protein